MKSIFKLSGLLVAILFFSSCSKNNLSDSSFQQERMAKLSAELEQNYSSSSIVSASANEEVSFQETSTIALSEKEQSSTKKISGKTNPVKTLKAIKNARKIIKEYKKAHPETIKDTKNTNKANLSQNMKIGILLAIIGLLIAIFAPYGYLFAVVGGILLIIGLVLILMELLEL
jgi:hypothetical protein